MSTEIVSTGISIAQFNQNQLVLIEEAIEKLRKLPELTGIEHAKIDECLEPLLIVKANLVDANQPMPEGIPVLGDTGVLPPAGSPSDADLDTVANEQKIAEATDGANTAPETPATDVGPDAAQDGEQNQAQPSEDTPAGVGA